MKTRGDHVIFAAAADDFARGRFAQDDKGKLFYRNGSVFTEILSVEYSPDGRRLIKRDK